MGPGGAGYVKCRNCGINILQGNVLVHVAFCERHFKKCENCSEIYKRDLQHVCQRGSKCNTNGLQVTDVSNVNNYLTTQKTTVTRLKKCKYCSIQLKVASLGIHEYQCGCRTEPCNVCGKYVMLRDKEDHVCSKSNEIHTSENDCATDTEGLSQNFDIPLRSPCMELHNSQQNSPTPMKSVKHYPQKQNSEYEESIILTKKNLTDSDKIPCEFCFSLFTVDATSAHQLSCELNPDRIVPWALVNERKHWDLSSSMHRPRHEPDSGGTVVETATTEKVTRSGDRPRVKSVTTTIQTITSIKRRNTVTPDKSKLILPPIKDTSVRVRNHSNANGSEPTLNRQITPINKTYNRPEYASVAGTSGNSTLRSSTLSTGVSRIKTSDASVVTVSTRVKLNSSKNACQVPKKAAINTYDLPSGD